MSCSLGVFEVFIVSWVVDKLSLIIKEVVSFVVGIFPVPRFPAIDVDCFCVFWDVLFVAKANPMRVRAGGASNGGKGDP